MSEIIFVDSANQNEYRKVRRQAEAGLLRRISPQIYTSNLVEPLEAVTLRHAFTIAQKLLPGSVVSARSAAVTAPARATDDQGRKVGPGFLFFTGDARRSVTLPGLELRVVKGPGPQPSDAPFMGLYIASQPRFLLENLVPSRTIHGVNRTIGEAGVETLLLNMCRREGEDHLNQIRDRARTLAPVLGLADQFTKLDEIIGALLRTRKASLATVEGRARADGRAYDPDCVTRMTLLASHLTNLAPHDVLDTSPSGDARNATAFIEAYFSNYIEGTRFLIDEAREIVFEGKIPGSRPKDGRDVISTYSQLINLGGRLPSNTSLDELIEELQERHAILQAARPENNPGRFKAESNQAGNTVFVKPSLVRGTLGVGIELLASLQNPFARAVFLHFMLTDVHPFDDGNGRLSRIMMTKELVGSGLSRIVIPTVYREDYVGALRALSRFNDPAPIVRALTFCQEVTADISEPTVDAAIERWAQTYAFQEPGAHAHFKRPDPTLEVEWHDGIPGPRPYWEASTAMSSLGLQL